MGEGPGVIHWGHCDTGGWMLPTPVGYAFIAHALSSLAVNIPAATPPV